MPASAQDHHHDHHLRASFEHHVVMAQGKKKQEGRLLQDGTCLCNEDDNNKKDNIDEPITVRMLAVGGEDHYLNFVPNRFSNRAPAFFQKTSAADGQRPVNVEVVRLGDLGDLNDEILADVQARVYDGYVFLPFLTGSLVEADGLYDLTEFVATNEDLNWLDIFSFNREVQSVYDNVVRLLPCDGDVHSLFYRKDLFEQFNVQVPRTWDEYTAVAEFFHGKQVPAGDGSNRTVTLSGSCVGRKPSCLDFGFFNILVHSTSTQSKGTRTGALFDPETFEPLMGEAMAETLKHLENQIRYGAADELTSESCSGINIEYMNAGTCAMTYMWGDSFARHLLDGSVMEGKLGIAPTPGVTKVLDRDTGKLVDCTPELCPFAEVYEDIGLVNRAPYAAAGGWSAGVSAGVGSERADAMAAFFGYACGEQESIEDVIPNAQGPLFTGTDPYRKSHFNISKWEERGYPPDTTVLYRETIEKQLSSENTVLDVRFPDANLFLEAMHDRIFAHLNESKGTVKTHQDRLDVADDIAAAWRTITRNHDIRPGTTLPLKAIYQKSLNVYTPPSESSSSLSAGAVAGVVIGCSVFVAIVTSILACLLIKREQKKNSMQWQIKREELSLSSEVLGEGTWGVIVKGHIRGTPVAVKTSRHTMTRLDSKSIEGTADSTTEHSSVTTLTTTKLREDLNSLVKLRNPHIVQTLGALIEKKTIMVVLEFMEYGSLSSVLSDAAGIASGDGRHDIELRWGIQIARGLDYLHSVPQHLGGPLLHTELRATNVLVDSSYNCKLTNFALESRVVGSRRDQGALLWTAPEVLNGAPPGPSSDIYSYGMVLYEIVARCRPFRVRRFSSTNLSEYTVSTLSRGDEDDDIIPSALIEGRSQLFGGRAVEYFGVENGEKRTVPEIVSRVSDLSLEPPVRPDLPSEAPLLIRDICVECWSKNPLRRPSVTEIVERLSRDVSPSSLTSQLAMRSSVFDSILPHDVQDMLARNETVPPKSYPNVTVIFSDIVGFTATSSTLTAEEVGDLIGRLFTKYDKVAAKYGVKKLDVIGDAFLGVAGIPNEESDHAVRAAGFALEAIEEAKKTPICPAKPHLGCVAIRFGLATGPVVATVIGSALHPKYTLFGTTVNTASRMESSSEANKVQATVETAVLLKQQAPTMGVHFRKKMDIKGRGELETYFLSAPADGFQSLLPRRKTRKSSARRSMGPIRLSNQGSSTLLSSEDDPTTHSDTSRNDVDMDITDIAEEEGSQQQGSSSTALKK